MKAEIYYLASNDHADWADFVRYRSPDPYDDYGWFHLTIGAAGVIGGNDSQVCIATPRDISRIRNRGFVPGIMVDKFDPAIVEKAIRDRIDSIRVQSWEQLVDRLREFMHWEYEGMAAS